MKINTLEKITVNNSEQWILTRSNKSDAPIILHVQAGPGLPMIPEANPLDELLQLEKYYIVS